MTAPSPLQLATSNAGWTVTANGQALPATIQVIAIDVWLGVNKLPKARIVGYRTAARPRPISRSATPARSSPGVPLGGSRLAMMAP